MSTSHKWSFKARFRRGAYGWKGTRLATQRLKEATSEIKKVAKSDPEQAGEGCVCLMERLWPSLEHIDTSSGALGGAVNHTLEALIPILIAAPGNFRTREKWLERLYQAVCDDGVDYLMPVEERWGEICVFPELANRWADYILPLLREAWGSGERGAHVCGSTLCLSCLLTTERYQELEEILSFRPYPFWYDDRFWAEALARQGRIDEAIEYAESRRYDLYDNFAIVRFCERTLLEAGRREEAYRLYGLFA